MKKIFIFLIFLLYASNLLAHKVNIFYYVENNTMFLETYFSDGTKCRNSEILVYDNDLNKLILKDKTDIKGKFQFKIPKLPANHSLKVVLNAEMGHRNEVIIKPSEWIYTEDDTNLPQTEATSETTKKQLQNKKYNCKEFEKILDKKLKPVLRELALLRNKKPSMNEIFGGIGYIFGFFGIILYFKGKK